MILVVQWDPFCLIFFFQKKKLGHTIYKKNFEIKYLKKNNTNRSNHHVYISQNYASMISSLDTRFNKTFCQSRKFYNHQHAKVVFQNMRNFGALSFFFFFFFFFLTPFSSLENFHSTRSMHVVRKCHYQGKTIKLP